MQCNSNAMLGRFKGDLRPTQGWERAGLLAGLSTSCCLSKGATCLPAGIDPAIDGGH